MYGEYAYRQMASTDIISKAIPATARMISTFRHSGCALAPSFHRRARSYRDASPPGGPADPETKGLTLPVTDDDGCFSASETTVRAGPSRRMKNRFTVRHGGSARQAQTRARSGTHRGPTARSRLADADDGEIRDTEPRRRDRGGSLASK